MTVEMYPSSRFRQTENKFNQRNERDSCLVILSSLDSRYFGILGLIIDTITLNYVFCASWSVFHWCTLLSQYPNILSLFESSFLNRNWFCLEHPGSEHCLVIVNVEQQAPLHFFSRKCSPASSVNNASKILNYCVNIFFVRDCKIKR